MTIHTDRIVLVFPIAEKNRQAAASLQTLEITESGKEFETLVPIDPALVANYASGYNLPLIATNQSLTNALATKTSELATATETLATQSETITSLQVFNTEQAVEIAQLTDIASSLQSSIQDLEEQVSSLEAIVTEKTATIAQHVTTIEEKNARIESLLAEVPFDPRVIDAAYFLKRVTVEETMALYTSGDPQVQAIAAMLKAYKDNDWPIILDSAEFVGAMQYLVSVELLTVKRQSELMKDCDRQESHRVGE
jgi:hypothetical protein